ncbi:MAG TPA: hypothetical protein VFO52_14235 [Longimicrobiales bacterium]|nr:hypothetical protein [Longimicrobiales bacterium]
MNMVPRKAGSAWLRIALLLAAAIVVATCDNSPTDGPIQPIGASVAYSLWTPGANDTCTRQDHDRYSTVGPDSLLYPTWHPAVDPVTGCSFGHEHGRDPRGSALYADVGPLPFGYANQRLDIYDPGMRRHEDHVGHKVEWENGVDLHFDGGGDAVLSIRCDVLTKLHQGTHSRDAFTNNLHEIIYHVRCTDGTRMSVTMLTAIGNAGEFVASCNRDRTIAAGTPTPANSPDGGGHRAIPDRQCIEELMLVPPGERANVQGALRESWETSNVVRRADGRTLAHFNPYYQVLFPSRYFDPTQINNVGRPLDVCRELTAAGDSARGASECEHSHTAASYDDVHSAFNGVLRFVDVNSNDIRNADGPEYWYTDPLGRNGRRDPFPGSIRQFIARIDNTGRGGSGPNIGRTRDYGEGRAHAPN